MAATSSSQNGKNSESAAAAHLDRSPICGAKPCIKGTRIWLSLILDFLAEVMTEAELLAEYPQFGHKDVLAAIAFGAEAARVRFVPVTAVRASSSTKRPAISTRRTSGQSTRTVRRLPISRVIVAHRRSTLDMADRSCRFGRRLAAAKRAG
jgi:uncharacterized protein (DUF433 family)